MTKAQDMAGWARARRIFSTGPFTPRWKRPNINGTRVRTFRGARVAPKCPTCGEHAIRLIIPWNEREGDWARARCNRCA